MASKPAPKNIPPLLFIINIIIGKEVQQAKENWTYTNEPAEKPVLGHF